MRDSNASIPAKLIPEDAQETQQPASKIKQSINDNLFTVTPNDVTIENNFQKSSKSVYALPHFESPKASQELLNRNTPPKESRQTQTFRVLPAHSKKNSQTHDSVDNDSQIEPGSVRLLF
jgi:hypothetical protein